MIHQHRKLPLWNRPFWKWWFSLRVGLVLLVLLTVASIIGTLIPAEVDAQGRTITSALARSQRLVFYSPWYLILLLVMAANMACSTIRTILEKVLRLARPRFMRQPTFYDSVPNCDTLAFGGDAKAVAAAFRRQGFKVATEGSLGYAFKGMLGRWGAPVTHLGLVIILLGGFASAWTAREGGVFLLEGDQTDHMTPASEAMAPGEPLGFTVRCDDFDTGFFPKTQIPSHFTSYVSARQGDGPWVSGVVEVNNSFRFGGWKFHQTNYQTIDDWERYELALRAPDSPTTRTVELSPGQRRAVAALPGVEVEISKAVPLKWTVYRQGQAVSSGPLVAALAGDWRLYAIQFEPDFVIDGKSVGSRSQTLNNPALKVSVEQGGQPVAVQWLFSEPRLKEMMRSMGHNHQLPFELDLVHVEGQAPNWRCEVVVRSSQGVLLGDYQLGLGQKVAVSEPTGAKPVAAPGGWHVTPRRIQAYATYLTMTRNPMIPVIYFGCAVMLAGTLFAFFIRFRQVWFRVDEAGRKLQVAAVYRHPVSGLDGATRAALARLDVEPLRPDPVPEEPVAAGRPAE